MSPKRGFPRLGFPPRSLVRRYDTHRLIPEKHTQDDSSVLRLIADSDEHLQEIFDLDHATNDRLLAENDLLPGIGKDELVFAVPNYRLVNAAFCHAHPLGSRFNGPDRGAWYSAFDRNTSEHEVAFHKALEFSEIDWPEEELVYRDLLADFSCEFHDLRDAPDFADCLDGESYVAAQGLAERLLREGSLGVVYPSVRHEGGTCLACFRPALVGHVRLGERRMFHYHEDPNRCAWSDA